VRLGLRPSFSLQRTLAIRFSLTMFAGLLGLALWGYLGVRDTLVEQLDRSLQSSARFHVGSLHSQNGRLTVPAVERGASIELDNRFLALRDSAGRILRSTAPLAAEMPLAIHAFEQSRGGQPTLVTQEWPGRRVRSIFLRVPPAAGSEAAVLQVGASLSPLEKRLSIVLLQMIGTVVLVSVATAIGAGWLAASAVAPVHRITAQARTISGELGGRRITAHADATEFSGLIEVMNAMVVRLERASEWHRRIIRDLGHDLRTPLTAMRAGVEVALWSERSPDEYRRILASALDGIDRLTLISDALVLLARLQAGEVKLDFAPTDARKLAREAVAALEGSADGHQITLIESPDATGIRADVRLMKMVLEQLLDNARRYTPPGSRIEISVQAHAQESVIVVEDNGSGLADEVLPHLFEPFYRSDTARAREGGPGLGLTATAAIIALHGGAVVAERGSQGGLRVTITLPRVHSISQNPEQAGRPGAAPMFRAPVSC
jgi:signal transduction histidine kinase